MMTITTLIERACQSLNNFFAPAPKKVDRSYIHFGTFTIENGSISDIGFILPNQYFRIIGSALNDGVYKNCAEDLQRLENEVFDGAIWEMAIPKSFIEVCEDIQAFNEKCEQLSKEDKGFTAESFNGVYSYSIGGSVPAYMQEWKNRLDKGLNSYRRQKIL